MLFTALLFPAGVRGLGGRPLHLIGGSRRRRWCTRSRPPARRRMPRRRRPLRYDDFRRRRRPPRAVAVAAEAMRPRGKPLFASNGCASCHTFKPANATGTIGPDLDKRTGLGREGRREHEPHRVHPRVDRRPGRLHREGLLEGDHADELRLVPVRQAGQRPGRVHRLGHFEEPRQQSQFRMHHTVVATNAGRPTTNSPMPIGFRDSARMPPANVAQNATTSKDVVTSSSSSRSR